MQCFFYFLPRFSAPSRWTLLPSIEDVSAKKGRAVDASIQLAYIRAIRRARRFAYIKNQARGENSFPKLFNTVFCFSFLALFFCDFVCINFSLSTFYIVLFAYYVAVLHRVSLCLAGGHEGQVLQCGANGAVLKDLQQDRPRETVTPKRNKVELKTWKRFLKFLIFYWGRREICISTARAQPLFQIAVWLS